MCVGPDRTHSACQAHSSLSLTHRHTPVTRRTGEHSLTHTLTHAETHVVCLCATRGVPSSKHKSVRASVRLRRRGYDPTPNSRTRPTYARIASPVGVASRRHRASADTSTPKLSRPHHKPSPRPAEIKHAEIRAGACPGSRRWPSSPARPPAPPRRPRRRLGSTSRATSSGRCQTSSRRCGPT